MRRLSTAMACLLAASFAATAPAFAQGVVLPLAPADRQQLDALLGAGVVGKPLPSLPIQDVSSYFPLAEKALSFRVTSGPNAGKTQTLNVAKGKRPGGNEAWRFELSPTLAAFLQQSEGDLLMPAVTDTDEGVVVTTKPANPFVLKGLKPGESRTFTQSVSVNYLDDPAKQDYSGSLNGTYTYLGNFQVQVPAGTYSALLVRLDYEGKVGPAHTRDMAYYLFAPGVGVVAMVSQEDVEAFWIIHIDTKSGKVLAATP